MRQAWLDSVGEAFPEGHAAGFPGYPLLGAETAEPVRHPHRWRLRLSLCQMVEPEQLVSLLEDVDEVRLQGEALALEPQLQGVERYLEGQAEGLSPCWALSEDEAATLGPLAARRVTWTSEAGGRQAELIVNLDSMLLRNLALLRSGPLDGPRLVVSSAVSAGGETEGLIADTVAYWTGAVAGVAALEVAQQELEDFPTLWARLNICRLLRWESELGQAEDACAGAGLFQSLADLKALAGG